MYQAENRTCAGDRHGERSEPGRAPALGLVSYETKVTRILVDTRAKRLKRMRTAVQHSSRLIDFNAGAGGRRFNKKFLTLTYAQVDGWSAGDIGAFVRVLRQWCKRRGHALRLVWVAELQQRGAMHYHAIVWIPKGVYFPKPDKCGWWPHGSSNIKTVSNPVAYLSKYASKGGPASMSEFPKGARIHGAAGLDAEGKRHLRYWHAPIWVRDGLSGLADIRKVVGGYVDRITGLFLESPWAVVFERGQVYAFLKPSTVEQ